MQAMTRSAPDKLSSIRVLTRSVMICSSCGLTILYPQNFWLCQSIYCFEGKSFELIGKTAKSLPWSL